MAANAMVRDGEKYSGKYVATRSFKDKKVLSSGNDPMKVFNMAKKKGAKDPVIFYVPEKDMVHIY